MRPRLEVRVASPLFRWHFGKFAVANPMPTGQPWRRPRRRRCKVQEPLVVEGSLLAPPTTSNELLFSGGRSTPPYDFLL